MTWVRIDDKAMQHPKLLKAGPEGVALWLAGLCHCNGYATDGVIDKVLVGALYPPLGARVSKIAERLVGLGLWLEHPAHYEVHDYETYQYEALKRVAAARLEGSEGRKKRDRERKRAVRQDKRPPDVPPMSARTSNGTGGGTNGGHESGPSNGLSAENPPSRARIPSRPVPSRPKERESLADCPTSSSSNGHSSSTPVEGSPKLTEPADGWRALAAVWERVLGLKLSNASAYAAPLRTVWQACVEQDASAPEAFFERAAELYAAEKRRKQEKLELNFLCREFATWAELALRATSNGPRGPAYRPFNFDD